MTEASFVESRQASWEAVARALGHLDAGLGPEPELFQRYRALSADLALARHRAYSQALQDRLNDLALRCHARVYRRPSRWRVLTTLLVEFPRAVRRDLGWVCAGHALFYGPFLGMMLAGQAQPEWLYAVLDGSTVAGLEAMYDPEADVLGAGREASTDLLMFGFYVRNNVSIALRCFASGLVLGVGSLFVLAYNGLYIGAAAAHLTRVGYISTFWGFVAGHSALELTAICLSGAAGLRLGFTLVQPGRRTRSHALQQVGRELAPVIYGFCAMLLGAAFIEAFWSSRGQLPLGLKLSTGALLWVLVLAWLGLGGRGR